MGMKRVSANAAKQNFGELLDNAQRQPVIVERHGRPKAVVMSYEEFTENERQKLLALRRDIGAGLNEIRDGKAIPLDIESFKRSMRRKFTPAKRA
jgi:prevent-host-death family protein